MSIFLDQIHSNIHTSWNLFLNEDVRRLLLEIENKLKDQEAVTPLPERVLHFMTRDVKNAKVVIIGQDPYPQEGVATGRAFEVGTLKSWHSTFRNTSLKNIVRALYFADTGNYLTFNQIKPQLQTGGLFDQMFQLLEPDELFKYWEEQGVLLLNTSFTCEVGVPGSHAKIWSEFTKQLLSYIDQKNENLNWFLWGNHAKEITAHLTLKNKYVTNHPMICKEGESDFLFGNTKPFVETSQLIDWTGKRKGLS
ncbi:uracil-DNA glycosylase [Carboxylicivirga sp. N1Y90]|uniref:uracil-DNA glycosylase n=1 Tax=Carboxylicivirga fragile TaxID=3417571 RepID=UPI003D3444B0|nr:uracil-DNA glycosylase [Marinilabiliaceae bacterium N1Y90]